MDVLKEKHLAATLNQEEAKISAEMNATIDQNNGLCKTVKEQLKRMEEIVEEAKKEDKDMIEPETRIKVINHQALTAKFAEVIKES
mmetsp:Transcript_21334/g.18477  ORF Transcript_21334/g.18477 Transcript_21334/m.18477 type:complete len:86 (+) Transcript_21334:230-487(+)